MAILTETDSRPGLIGYEETNKPLYSENFYYMKVLLKSHNFCETGYVVLNVLLC